MQFSKLKLTGFKSFVEPSTLRIEPGLTGVVGPNGCGKSNLLEAIRWVMGENSPKSMRSGGMEDVIFAGTEARPPRDFAEVVLEAETDDGDELQVVRRIERGAGSAYRVNGRDVRAKDVALTFADAATGAHSPALVSQGKIAAVIAAKPTERRQMLEEAAGIAGLHVRRKDAESKLRSTEKNLERLEDLMAGLDSQISSLKRQARQAERYTKLTGEIQAAEARLVFARWRDAAAAADAARAEAEKAEARVAEAKARADGAQKAQQAAAIALAEAREEVADRRDDASAHGHRMAALTSQLEAAEQRLADLDRQKARLEEDRGEADRLTKDAAVALQRLERELTEAGKALAADEERRPALAAKLEDAERASRTAELALAKATADHAGVEAEWRVAQAAIEQAEARLARLDAEARRQAAQREDLLGARDPDEVVAEARADADAASKRLADLREELEAERARKDELQQARDAAAEAQSAARAELAGIEREYAALERDRAAREKRQKDASGRHLAIDGVRAAAGYERAVAAVLGRDAKTPVGSPQDKAEGRFWTGRSAPARVADSLAAHVLQAPEELAARLALVHVAESDDGRDLAPGEWLVTMSGALRRWDGFVARGEGGAEAARLEAENRHAELAAQLPELRDAAERAEAQARETAEALGELQRGLVARERDIAAASEDERGALRALDQAEAAKERLAARMEQLDAAADDLAEQRKSAENDLEEAQAKKSALPDPAAGRAQLEAAQAKNEAARALHQSATGELAAHDQALAVGRERTAAQQADISGWQARAGDAARRLSDMGRRFEEIEEERAVIAAKPAGLMREIEGGEATRQRLGEELAKAQAALEAEEAKGRAADSAFSEANEALAAAREMRAASTTRAENEEERRREMGRISGERFQSPPPLLPAKFDFAEDEVKPAPDESAMLEKLTADRERIGPVNLVAAEELAKIEQEHGASAEEQAELHEAVNRLRGSIGSLNREGRERLRAAFTEVNAHFKRLFTALFEGGQAYLELIDSDDPLEAGLEIFAQPPGKRLQSLTLLSGGEQALTAVALIFGLFLTNPAPICVLDEVDAPLDDANIDRFCDLLDRMTRETDTRYLIVTHNAVTMSRMHRLFGVTMIEKGISRLVSVDLGGAEELLAAE
ncbi:chromosome segregation protein SMC [Alteriqipengyuania flavescens]|uniref:chromosome segregation protein SMC n=1 Tax=Alteriqipengyuania flavescens TaxID=3053610 RepID=UPI0025B412B5|nr:chromosome segregation protein SMC [Alteriqipengyuania flavescens]WJY18819.1 chromosome segregation protein SMC [Alteriqipengyuania flavescens]WJY24759.1 chromosome segregation protein SMC [Alteriqipengyuania flavescens]